MKKKFDLLQLLLLNILFTLQKSYGIIMLFYHFGAKGFLSLSIKYKNGPRKHVSMNIYFLQILEDCSKKITHI